MGDDIDKRYMRLALRLALKGAGRTSPNPMVGAVLVRNGKIVGTGYHKFAGSDHGEIVALKQAGDKARGATLYLNLEPCNHEGKTPPCTISVIRAGVKKVVTGMVDPNPLVSGRGIHRLRRQGVQVQVGFLEAECQRLNEAFSKYITRRIPFVTLKLAASLDGKIATSTGESQWITGKVSRAYVHHIRNQVDAVMVGVGTVLADDPRLTCRSPGGRHPWRVILDGHLRIPLTARLLHQREPEKTILVTGSRPPIKKIKRIQNYGAQVWNFPLDGGRVRLISILKRLGKMGLISVMVEGGPLVASYALRAKVVDKILFFYGPKIIGGEGKAMVEAMGIEQLSHAKGIKDMEIKQLGNDFLISGYL
ncbi:MAG: bifunctional diaminohydroxyphosphoribosylaminopyrimidine deaminase/5-amino-6-(5-phosphoribosylamino)uracil reductase RibD [Candidatus Binatia bacterium]